MITSQPWAYGSFPKRIAEVSCSFPDRWNLCYLRDRHSVSKRVQRNRTEVYHYVKRLNFRYASALWSCWAIRGLLLRRT